MNIKDQVNELIDTTLEQIKALLSNYKEGDIYYLKRAINNYTCIILRTDGLWFVGENEENPGKDMYLEILIGISDVLKLDESLKQEGKYYKMWKDVDVVNKRLRQLFISIIKNKINDVPELDVRMDGYIYIMNSKSKGWFQINDFCLREVDNIHMTRCSLELLAKAVDNISN